MKTIAITQRLVEHSDYNEIRNALDVRFCELFEGLGFLPLPLLSYTDFARYLRLLPIDGVVLSGGNDLSSVESGKLSSDRDAFERRVLDLAIKSDTPVLGICRGMQLIAEYFGCSLKRLAGHAATEHPIVAAEDTEYSEWLRPIRTANSYHKYGVDRVSESIEVLARSDDGEIEALCHRDHRVLGHMWHPERGPQMRCAELALIRHFFA